MRDRKTKNISLPTLLLGISLTLSACLGIEMDDFSGVSDYTPTLSIPFAESFFSYDDTSLLPPHDTTSTSPIDLVLIDAINVDLANTDIKRELILSLLIRLDIINKFPQAIEVELYYYNTVNKKTLYTTPNVAVAAATTNTDGSIDQAALGLTDIILSDEQIDELYSTKQIFVQTTLKDLTFTSTFVEQLPNYSTTVNIGLQYQLLIHDYEE